MAVPPSSLIEQGLPIKGRAGIVKPRKPHGRRGSPLCIQGVWAGETTLAASESPTCSCLILCEEVLTSVVRGKHVLHGVIGHILVPSVPARIGPFAAYVRFQNVYPNQEVRIALRKDGDAEPVFELRGESTGGSNPLGLYTFIIAIPPFVVSAAGRYYLTASHDGVAFADSLFEIQTHAPDAQEE